MAKIQELTKFKLSDAVKFNDTLNPAIWQDEKLKPEVREQLEKIARHFAEYLGVSNLKIEDITISGSNAAFTWTPHSDLDLHLLVDFSKLPDSDVYRELFNAKKMLYNSNHSIMVKKIPVELYVQDTNEDHYSVGEYSILNDDWISIPKKEKPNFDEAATKLKYEKLGELVELALKSKDLNKVENVLAIIKRYRKAGLSKTGEFGPENIAYKAVRKQGLIQELFDLKKDLESKNLSIDEQLNETVEESELVNLLSRYAVKDIIQLLRKDKNNAHKNRKEKLLDYGLNFLDFNLPKINDKNMLSYLKDLRVLVTNNNSDTTGSKNTGTMTATYEPFTKRIILYLDVIKLITEQNNTSLMYTLTSNLAHEIQHHIDNIKSDGKVFKNINPTNREEYLKLLYEANSRTQQAFLEMGRVILKHQRDNKPITSRQLKNYIIYALVNSKLDQIYDTQEPQYKQLVKRIYKYADKVINSPAMISPPAFAQKIITFINGKTNMGTINEVADDSYLYKENQKKDLILSIIEMSQKHFGKNLLYGGNCGTFALALACILEEKSIPAKLVVICEDIYETEAEPEDILASDARVYHVAVYANESLYDGDGKVTPDSIADWIEEEYHDYNPAVFNFDLHEPNLRRMIENTTNWNIPTEKFYSFMKKEAINENIHLKSKRMKRCLPQHHQ